MPRLPQISLSTVNLAEVVSKVADSAQPLNLPILAHLARTDSAGTTVAFNAGYLGATATPWTCVHTRAYMM